MNRIKSTHIKQLITAKLTIELGEGQAFYQTPKAYEIWQEEPDLRRVKRIPKTQVLWIIGEWAGK